MQASLMMGSPSRQEQQWQQQEWQQGCIASKQQSNQEQHQLRVLI